MRPGYGPRRVSTPPPPPPLSVAEAMSRSGFYPGSPPVTVCETHTAWVFLAGDRAYKVKKPVQMGFLDFSTLEQRHLACLEELDLNRKLAPGIGLRVRAVVPLTNSYVLVDADAAGAVEYAIEMRRFDEARTMAAHGEAGTLTDEQVRAVARRLAAFHAAAPVLAPHDPVGDLKRTCDRNLRDLLALADTSMVRRVMEAERFTDAFLVTHRDEITARAEAGSVRDGHGDLRAEHVVLQHPIAIVDRIEFDPHLRQIDVADDLAFLVMDLERLGAHDAARLLVASYRQAGGDPGSDTLLSFHGVHRALVRVKVGMLRAAQLDDPAAVAVAREQAGELLDLAERLTWRARGPLVLAVNGPPASGKSTLAAALSHRSGWPVLSSDVLRKDRRDIAPTATAPQADYTLDARAAIYHELGDRARAARADGQGTIVDATFGDPQLRAAFLAGLGDQQRLLALECRAPKTLRERWARERTPADARGSDAAPDVAARLAASFTGWDELPQEAILTLGSSVVADMLIDQIADWLDTRVSVVSPGTARADTEAAGTPRN
jgi:aminoglycoside phosphotransferase family enzyme/predicted kinase